MIHLGLSKRNLVQLWLFKPNPQKGWPETWRANLINQIKYNKGAFRKILREGWILFNFCLGNLGVPPMRIGRIWVPPPLMIGRIWVPPPYIYVQYALITPLYVFNRLIWSISFFRIISIWQNLGARSSLGRLANLPPSPPMNGATWVPPPLKSLYTSCNVYWMVPNYMFFPKKCMLCASGY